MDYVHEMVHAINLFNGGLQDLEEGQDQSNKETIV